LREADKIIIVFDNSKPVEKEDREIVEFIEELELQKTDKNISILPVLNKADLPCKLDLSTLVGKTFEPMCQVSALNGDGLSTLEKTLISEFKEFTKYRPERPIVFTKRQLDYLSEALLSAEQCIHLIDADKDTSNYSNYFNDLKQSLLNCIDDFH
jgi:tRNA modification GTPase